MTLSFINFWTSLLTFFLLHFLSLQSLVADNEFQHILRVLNTNIKGRERVPIAITAIKGCGRRFANLICKKAEINLGKR